MIHPVLEAIRTQRVVRSLTDQPVATTNECVLDAGRWATSAGSRRPHRFVAIQEPVTIRLLRGVTGYV
jgi:nitroreductase